jgi:hypothetical protein
MYATPSNRQGAAGDAPRARTHTMGAVPRTENLRLNAQNLRAQKK